MLKNNGGFTLIELIMIIIILGILAAVAIPKYQDLSSEARTAAFRGGLGAVKSARVILIAQNKGTKPSLSALVSEVEGGTFIAANTGLTIADLKKSSGTLYQFLTYTTDTAITDYATCAGGTATAAVGDTVECIKCENDNCTP